MSEENKNIDLTDNDPNLITNQPFSKDMASLTEKEQFYFRVMWAKYGVLFITAKPGVAKSAIARSIAEKMGFRYMDIRLSMVDETDVGLFPNVSDIDGVKVLDHVVPRWAVEANKRPTIIHFEELNRATQAVRNAALQILLEREIGTEFEFNENVLMMSSGNLGDEDGTDVEEFDSALNNRLIHVKHTLGVQEWMKNFGEEHVHATIIGYLQSHPEKLYVDPTDDENYTAYASPRSWTMMSEFIVKNFGKKASARDFLPTLKNLAGSYVGHSAMKYIQYCEDMLNISIQDVLNNYPKVKKDIEKYNRDKKSELIQSLKKLDLNKLSDKQLKNCVSFLKTIDDDELTGYLLFLVDNNYDVTGEKLRKFLLNFRETLVTIHDINNK
jgi:hypothetical protein